MMERGLMDEILTEQGFQQTGCASDECIVEMGKLVGVKQIIGGSINSNLPRLYILNVAFNLLCHY